ncbi:hypothetical protein BH09BAC6_BH09BAC6_00800 [soil metagenome]|jgi:nitrogen-specific signal transduction histidine kinase
MDAPDSSNGLNEEDLLKLKHDVKNQLSNINLALEQLRYEVPDQSADLIFYFDTIADSANRINELINGAE